MTSRFLSRAAPDENGAVATAAAKPELAMANPAPKRALGDITNTAAASAATGAHGFKSTAAVKLRRGNIAATKPNASNSAAARRARARALMAAKKASSVSPMHLSATQPRRASGRLAKRAAAAAVAASVSCQLDFGSEDCDTFANDPLMQYDTLRCPAGVLDIDTDLDNELQVGQYANAIHRHYRNVECKYMADPDYMTGQQDITIKMRAILVDWLVDVHAKFHLSAETLYLTVNIIDRFLEKKTVMRRKLQLVGVTAMFIASKYEEIYAPEVSDYVYISDRAYTREEILSMEAIMLNELGFEVTVPTAVVFLRRALKAAQATLGGEVESHEHLAHYIVELALQDSSMLRFRPSMIGAAGCNLAAKLCCAPLHWDATMTYHCGGWDEADIVECEKQLQRLLAHERDVDLTNKLTAVKRKFGQSKYDAVSSNADIVGDQVCAGMDLTE